MTSNNNTSTTIFGLPLVLSLVSNVKHLVQILIDIALVKSHKKANIGLGGEHKLGKEDVKVVMNKLGMFISTCEGHKDEAINISEDEVLRIFEEEEPSLEELKEAFEVFDENKDGFIDASELGRVLCKLGFVKEYGSSECLKMIKAFDVNGDGVIDFSEFVNFMEICFNS